MVKSLKFKFLKLKMKKKPLIIFKLGFKSLETPN